MNNVIVIYHYVRDNSNINSISTDDFRKQIEYISKRRRFITIDELLTKKPKDKTCIITFDDGLSDGYKNALPILQEFNAVATFFVPTCILNEEKLLLVQKRHLLFSKIGIDRFVYEFNKISEQVLHIEDVGVEIPFDDSFTSSVKYILDYIKTNKPVSLYLLDKIFDRYFDEKEEFRKMYLKKHNIDRMIDFGMEIGSHGYSHSYLGNLCFKDMKQDLLESVFYTKEFFGIHPSFISYPFGSYNVFAQRVLKELGFRAGFNTVEKHNYDIVNPYDLNRYDCISIYPYDNGVDIS